MEAAERPDVCYLDPMFPPPRGGKGRSSAVKKDMAMLHALLLPDGENEDEDEEDATGGCEGGDGGRDDDYDDARRRTDEEQELLLAACAVATRRVVVKRPVGALPLGFRDEKDDRAGDDDDDVGVVAAVPRPTYDVRGSTNRFDVYVIS